MLPCLLDSPHDCTFKESLYSTFPFNLLDERRQLHLWWRFEACLDSARISVCLDRSGTTVAKSWMNTPLRSIPEQAFWARLYWGVCAVFTFFHSKKVCFISLTLLNKYYFNSIIQKSYTSIYMNPVQICLCVVSWCSMLHRLIACAVNFKIQ